MPQIFSRGDSVYQCDTCNRRTRIPANERGLEVIQRCIITNDCPGKLHRVVLRKDINKTPASTPKVAGVQDWAQRRVLFDYVQSIEALVWTIHHNLGSIPTLQVFINKDTSEGEIAVETTDYVLTVIDLNTVTITFENAQSGTAQCIAHASQNTTNPQPAEVPPGVTNVQISNSGILTIVTLATAAVAPLIDITVIFKNPIDNTLTKYLFDNVDAIPDAESPWAGAYQIMVAGRIFDVRTIDVTTKGPIVNGSQMTIKIGNDMDDDHPAPYITNYKSCLLLLGKPPYAVPDRITDKYIDLAAISTSLSEMFYSGGEVMCSTDKIKSTYPPVVVVE